MRVAASPQEGGGGRGRRGGGGVFFVIVVCFVQRCCNLIEFGVATDMVAGGHIHGLKIGADPN